MIIKKKYSGDKFIEGDYTSLGVKGKSRRSILNNALVCDIITFDYRATSTSLPGEDHDYRPQLLILGSNSMQYSGLKRMEDMITGINLHYCTQGEANRLIDLSKIMFKSRMSAPRMITETIMRRKLGSQHYRQYLTSKISRFNSLYSLGSLENVQDELSRDGSPEEYKKELREKIVLKVTKNEIKTGADDALLNNLGFESDIYK